MNTSIRSCLVGRWHSCQYDLGKRGIFVGNGIAELGVEVGKLTSVDTTDIVPITFTGLY
jgi:hypothetical protein